MKIVRFFKSSVIIMLIALSVGMSVNISGALAAFGTSPPWVQSEHVLPGSAYEQIVYLSRSDSEVAMQASIRMDGDEDLIKWIKIQDADNLILEIGKTVFPMTVIIEVPEDASSKRYTGGLFVTLSPVKTDNTLEGGEVGIGLGAHVLVDITVASDKVTDYDIRAVSVEAKAEEDAPLSVSMKVENTGNTEISELVGKIDVYNSTNTEILESSAFKPVDATISPYETKEVKMFFEDLKLKPGSYWVAVEISKDGETIYEDRHLQKVGNEVIPIIMPDNVFETKSVFEADNNNATTLYENLTDEKTSMFYLLFCLAALMTSIMLYIRHK